MFMIMKENHTVFKPEVQSRVQDHYNESLEFFDSNHIVGIFLQGSQNYGLEISSSDVDTKLITLPTFEEIAFNKKPISTTHVRANNEHIDFKDVRLYMQTFRKQNLNFLEILFTQYKILNPTYAEDWQKLIDNREKIARYHLPQAINSMRGIAHTKYAALEHYFEGKEDILAKYGYDPKQLHHLLRVEDYIERYIAGESYESCLHPSNPEYLLNVKLGKYDLTYARQVAAMALIHVDEMCDKFLETCSKEKNAEVDALLDEVQLSMMKKSVREDLK